MLTGLKAIDDSHHAVMQLASQLTHCHDHEVLGFFRTMLSELEQTFRDEQRLMEEFQFPAIHCHLEQHARALAALHYLHPTVMAGDHASARRVGGELLPEWFQLHMATQDAALGVWVAYIQGSNQGSNQRSDQHSVMEQLTTARDRLTRQILHPHYSNQMQPHFILHPAHEKIRHQHIDPLA